MAALTRRNCTPCQQPPTDEGARRMLEEVLPEGRARDPYGSEPTLVGDSLNGFFEGCGPFPFRTWAARNGFQFDSAAASFFARCGSAAEAYFARPFIARPGIRFEGRAAIHRNVRLELQVPIAKYRADAVVSMDRFRLAIEVDGMAFHQRSAEQVAADYLRQRRIVCAGHTVIRFTASEVFGNPEECWRQIDLILEANN